jgi:hypothetical protein
MKKTLISILFALSFAVAARAQTITFVQEFSATCGVGNNCNSITVTPSSSVTAGNLLVAQMIWGLPGQPACNWASLSDGTSNFIMLSPLGPINSASETEQLAYLLSANAGTPTYTLTFAPCSSGNAYYPELEIMEFHLSSGHWAYDTISMAGNSGSSVVTGPINTVGSAELLLFMSTTYGGTSTPSSVLINGSSPAGSITTPYGGMWFYYSTLSAPASGVEGTLSWASSETWTSALAGFYAVSSVTAGPAFVQAFNGNGGTSTTSFSITPSLPVAAGDLLVAQITWGAPGFSACYWSSLTDGISTFTLLTPLPPINSGSETVQVGYLLAANAGTLTYTVTYYSGCAAPAYFAQMVMTEFHISGKVWAYDTISMAGAVGTQPVVAGPINTAGTQEVLLFLNQTYGAVGVPGSVLLNSVTPAILPTPNNSTWNYYWPLTATATGAEGAFSWEANQTWTSAIVGFYTMASPSLKPRPQVWIN